MILQRRLKERLNLKPPRKPIRLVAGVDCAVLPDEEKIVAAAVLLALPGLEPVESSTAVRRAHFPYIPGLLSFREGPAILAALRKLKRLPDALLIDGQGIAHPRGFGLAAHIGMWLGIPSVGCAKRRLVGTHRKVGARPGDFSPLVFDGRAVGAVLRTREGAKPVFISPGHLADLDSARALAMRCANGHRLPEPTRLADALAGETARAMESKRRN